MRSFTACVGGKVFEIPTSMRVLHAAQEASGVNFLEAIASNRLTDMLQGVLYAGMTLAGEEVTYDEVADLVDFVEARDNGIAFLNAMIADVSESSAKNASRRSHNKP